MGRARIIRLAADLAFLVIQQPADTFLRCMALNKWAVLIWHDATLAKPSLLCRLQRSTPNGRVKRLKALHAQVVSDLNQKGGLTNCEAVAHR